MHPIENYCLMKFKNGLECLSSFNRFFVFISVVCFSLFKVIIYFIQATLYHRDFHDKMKITPRKCNYTLRTRRHRTLENILVNNREKSKLQQSAIY